MILKLQSVSLDAIVGVVGHSASETGCQEEVGGCNRDCSYLQQTIADCRLLPTLRNFQKGHIDHVPTSCLDKYTEISEYIKFMMSLPAVKAWYQKKPASSGNKVAENTPFTKEQLAQYRGESNGKPTYLCAKGVVFDVSSNDMYKVGSTYHLFTGHDASRSLAKMSLDPSDLNGVVDDLTEAQLSTLDDWFKKFSEKYPRVGVLKN